MASLHLQNTTVANEMLDQIKPIVGTTSTRFRRLLALCLESEGEYDQALAIYNDLKRQNPSNVYALKRIYSLHNAQVGKEEEARELLNDYLERNGSDAGAWMELSDSCAALGDWAGAAHALEEVVLVSPLDSNIHCKLAEYYVTMGDYVKGRKHFCQSLELNSKNLRAVYGLMSAAEGYLDSVENMTGAGQGDNNNKKKNAKNKASVVDEEDVELAKDLLQYGNDKLVKAYKGTAMSGLVTSAILS